MTGKVLDVVAVEVGSVQQQNQEELTVVLNAQHPPWAASSPAALRAEPPSKLPTGTAKEPQQQ